MKIYTSILTLLLCSATFVFGAKKQSDPSIKWTKDIISPNFQNLNVLKVDTSIIICASYKVLETDGPSLNSIAEKPHILVYDKKTGKTSDIIINLKNENTKRSIIQLFLFNNTLHIYTSSTNSDQKTYVVFDETFSMDSLKSNNDVRKITELNYGNLDGASKGSINTDVRILFNRLFVNTEINYKQGKLNVFDVFDNTMSKKASYQFSVDDKDLTKERTYLDHNDNLYLLLKNETNKELPGYDLHFFSGKDSTHRIKSFNEINVTGTPVITVNKNDELLVAGLFSKPNQNSAIGTFSICFPPRLEGKGNMHTYNFSEAFQAEGLNKEAAEYLLNYFRQNKDPYKNYQYLSDSIHLMQNGDFSFISEMYAEAGYSSGNKLITQNSNGIITDIKDISISKRLYTYGNLLAITFSQNGELKWSRNIARNNEYIDNGCLYGHYLPYYSKENSISLLVTTYREYKSIIMKQLYKGTKIIDKIKQVRIDSTGNRTDEPLFSDPYITDCFMPSSSRIQEDGTSYLVRFSYNPFKSKYNVGEYKFTH